MPYRLIKQMDNNNFTSGLFNDDFNSLYYIASHKKKTHESLTGSDVDESVRGLICRIIPAYASRTDKNEPQSE
jgi:hypothetical protein